MEIPSQVSIISRTRARFLRTSNAHRGMFNRLPTDAIGLRSFLYPIGRSLVSLLSHPQITTSLGDESVEGVATVILKVGPGIPVKERPGFLGNDGYVKLWIAPSLHSLAIRTRISLPERVAADAEAATQIQNLPAKHRIDLVTLKDFRPVVDHAKGNPVTRLPFVITYKRPRRDDDLACVFLED